MKAKHHFIDQHGPICGVREHFTGFVGPRDLREVRQENLQTITCKRCVKKLTEWGFAIQNFTEAVRDVIRK